jgi:2-oxoglutarate dehydrogenase complex dehydrogenase (E1) component-like enzyme
LDSPPTRPSAPHGTESDLAKGFDAPIVHVNTGDGPVSAVRLALAFRERFGHDVVVDLSAIAVSATTSRTNRRTQPLMAQAIAGGPTVREQYAASVLRGLVTA